MIAAHSVPRLSPVQVAFFGSLLLSFVAIVTSPALNRDGILYVETAQIFLHSGFIAARNSFDWLFLPLLMAAASKLTGLGIETAGHLLNALFMAGTCALLVASAGRRMPEAIWPICLTVLALPAFNGYREELLREYGCWFFVMLAFWLALRWDESPGWRRALLAQSALLTATLFRPEAAVFFAALGLWQLFATPGGARGRQLLMIVSVPLTLSAVAVVGLIVVGQYYPGGRITDFARHFDASHKRALLDLKAQALAAALLPYARDQARTIVMLGSLAIIPLKFVKQLGLFIVPLFFLFRPGGLRPLLARAPLFAWAFIAHLVVLSAFVIDMQFLAGRYVAVLSLLAAPFIGAGLAQLIARYPRWKNYLLLVTIVLMVINVVPREPGKGHFAHAGQWLAANVVESPRIYVQSTRVAYYAGWKINRNQAVTDRAQISAAIAQGTYDLFVLEVPARDSDIEPWLAGQRLEVVKRFTSRRNGSVIIAKTSP